MPADHPVRRPQPAGQTGKGNPYLKGILGEAAAAAPGPIPSSGNATPAPGKRRGKLKALVAIARTILVIVWHLLADRSRPLPRPRRQLPRQPHRQDRKIRNHIRQLEALGYTVTLTQAA